ncbi:MAG: rod shape-determining protein MreC [Hyphomicrobiales bacterium]|nr:rod shape-determining protein MreC [Hyphomicrobiales bacterium]
MRKGSLRHRSETRSPRVRGGLFIFALFFASFVLLILSKLENDVVSAMRGQFSDLAAPVLEWASLPAVYAKRGWERTTAYLSLYDDIERLKQENERLKQWQWRGTRMERRLNHLRALLNAIDEQALDQATGRVIADARGPFVRSILLNVGRQQGVKTGYAVINGDGLVGRTVHVGESAARVILLNDLNSRIPVLIGPSAVRGVLAGDNTGQPRLEFLPESNGVFEGDEVYTSGDAGLLPRGIRIGFVEGDNNAGFRVRTLATLSELEFVSVLFFDAPLVMETDERSPRETAAGEAEQAVKISGQKRRHVEVSGRERPQKR